MNDQILIPEIPSYKAPAGFAGQQVSDDASFTIASVGSQDNYWNIHSTVPYRFGYHSVHGSFESAKNSYQQSAHYHWSYFGKFHCARMFINNDPSYGCSRVYVTGDFKAAFFKAMNEDINIVTHKLHYDVDEKAIGAPKNRFRGYFNKVEIEIQGGALTFTYPTIREVSFWGWPMSPVDTREDTGAFPSLSYVQYYDTYRVENGKLSRWVSNKITGELQSTMDWVRTRDMLDARDRRNQLSGLKPFDQIKREGRTEDAEHDVTGLINYTIGGNLPADPFDTTDRYAWNFFLIDGCFFRIELVDTTRRSRSIVFGPSTRIRIYPTAPFPIYG